MSNPLGLLAELVAPFDSILARVWMVGPEEEDDPGSRRCLRLKASAGITDSIEGRFRQLPLDGHPMDQVVVRGIPFVANQPLEGRGLAEDEWIQRHGARTFALLPMRRGRASDDEIHGALGIFSRRILSIDDDRGLAAIARLLSIALDGVTPRRLSDVEGVAIERALAVTGGRVSGPLGAARLLGLKPTTLHSRMKKLGIRRVRDRATMW
jgi:hypothetical protein